MKQFPNVDVWLHRAVIVEPPLCSLHQLEDGTYSIEDVLIMNELLDLKESLKPKKAKKYGSN